MEGNVESVEVLKGKIISIPKVDNTLTKEGYAADAKATGDALAERVKTADIVDNLTTEDAEKPLSAKQGAELKKEIEKIDPSTATGITYNNEDSGLEADNMQGAIDEVAGIAKNAVSKDGGDMIEGAIHVRNVDNGHSSLNKNHSATADYGTQVVDTSASGQTAHLDISALYNSLSFTGNDNVPRTVLHEGNKPFANYTGNGSTSARTVATGGIGRLLMVYNSSYTSLVMPGGALVVERASGEISWIDSAKVYYLNGDLFLNTNNAAFNTADETYHYQAI